jgi:pimeloyl-ACP methyl ester carboxylesterase
VFYSKGSDATKPTLLFLHGFPSSSYDWRHQVAYFQHRGHGIIVPDLLGYGGSDKPTDAALYAKTLLAKDVIDVLDAVHVDGRVIAIGHDWGAAVASRLANLYSDRFLAVAFLAVGYTPPNTSITYPQVLARTKQLAGYELFGYWSFFSEDGADKIIHDHYDFFWRIVMSMDAETAKIHFAPTGALKAYLLGDNSLPFPSYLTEEEYNIQKDNFAKTGIAAPLCWYKAVTSESIDMEDAKSIPQDKYVVTLPVFFGAALGDVIAIPALGKGDVQKFCPNATIKDYEAGHWVIWEAKDKLNADLAEWIATLKN